MVKRFDVGILAVNFAAIGYCSKEVACLASESHEKDQSLAERFVFLQRKETKR